MNEKESLKDETWLCYQAKNERRISHVIIQSEPSDIPIINKGRWAPRAAAGRLSVSRDASRPILRIASLPIPRIAQASHKMEIGDCLPWMDHCTAYSPHNLPNN